MNPMPLEYRIMAALLLGSATAAELALSLATAKEDIRRRLQWLKKQLCVHESGTTRENRFGGRHSFRYELSPAGRRWVEEMFA